MIIIHFRPVPFRPRRLAKSGLAGFLATSIAAPSCERFSGAEGSRLLVFFSLCEGGIEKEDGVTTIGFRFLGRNGEFSHDEHPLISSKTDTEMGATFFFLFSYFVDEGIIFILDTFPIGVRLQSELVGTCLDFGNCTKLKFKKKIFMLTNNENSITNLNL